MYTDRTISCLDCGTEFSFTAGEQEFYEQRGFADPPKRCPSCRARRKAQRQPDGMGNGGPSAGGGYSSYAGADRGSYGGGYAAAGADGGYRERSERELFDVVCADCGSPARVPFRPSGVRPVYCSNCFQGRR